MQVAMAFGTPTKFNPFLYESISASRNQLMYKIGRIVTTFAASIMPAKPTWLRSPRDMPYVTPRTIRIQSTASGNSGKVS
eukprot:CAMPEP_0178609384 /NCGR_PEP_ID=MMETSP0697-20121206/38622_1 /TAXON_ID=265572 /ORGANISM="Extubocellulus spinifer, Strain CCMP396" /LENGTH=79 /DNA_ID=CAMNT_0020247965 /DNA_START=475 /DNA_END=710 /DNA_ORIENTATION=-